MFGAATGGLVIYGVDPALDLLVRDYTIVEGSSSHRTGMPSTLCLSRALPTIRRSVWATRSCSRPLAEPLSFAFVGLMDKTARKKP